jgi:hypothetical protein
MAWVEIGAQSRRLKMEAQAVVAAIDLDQRSSIHNFNVKRAYMDI